MEKYIFARSSDSASYYPNNKPYDFRVHLDNALDLHGYWKIGISEFFTQRHHQQRQSLIKHRRNLLLH